MKTLRKIRALMLIFRATWREYKAPQPNLDILNSATDCKVWAETFLASVKRNPTIATDVGALMAWFSMAIENGRSAGQRAPLEPNVAEACFAFGAYLTTRPEILEVGSSAPVPPMIDCIQEFLSQYELSPLREDWDMRFERYRKLMDAAEYRRRYFPTTE